MRNIIKSKLLRVFLLTALYSTTVVAEEQAAHTTDFDAELFQAAHYGRLTDIKKCIGMGANVNFRDEAGAETSLRGKNGKTAAEILSEQ